MLFLSSENVIITAAGIILAPAMLKWMRHQKELIAQSTIYLRIY